MADLREQVAREIYDAHGPLDGPNACGWDSLPDYLRGQFLNTAAYVLAIPEIREALLPRLHGGMTKTINSSTS